ncbi:MAG: efflux RND transporter periplasmic adaptor subunit [Methylohalobius sp. ZOD2]
MTQDNIDQVLGLEHPPTKGRRILFWLGMAALLAAIVAVVAWLRGNGDGQMRYITSEARRGDLTVTVTATGALEPLNQVEVGTEVSGTIETVVVDYNDRVERGQVLAELDTEQLEAQRRQTEASLALAKAKVREAKATLQETRNKLIRARQLVEKALISREEFEIAEANYLRAQATLASAEAQVKQTRAQLDENLRVLEKAVIRSPIDGIVLERKVESGQTVAASLQTPILFTLAENLSQMELHVAVDEADVGLVRKGQEATFTVDAYPNRHFQATITQVRYAPQTIEGVVTYETVLAVSNADLWLRPGMTATAEIIVNRIEDALLVPNTALRFTPPATETPETRSGGSVFSKLFPRPPSTRKPNLTEDSPDGAQQVWILRNNQPAAIPVTIGVSDGVMSEVRLGNIRPGTPLVVDVVMPAS